MSRLYRPKLGRHRQRPIVILRPQPQPRPNSDPNIIYIKDIATETPAGSNVWIINNDLTIGPGQYLGIDQGGIIITNYNLTNNGEFNKISAAFYFLNKSKNFINNGKFENSDGLTVNFGTFIVNGKPLDIIKNIGGNIVNFGANYDGIIEGHQVQNVTLSYPH
jgi:hypothetical protein